MKAFFIPLIFILFAGAASAQQITDPSKTSALPLADYIASTSVLDVQPGYPGGIKEFYSFIGDNFHVPDVDKEMQAKILLSFVVEKDGTLTDIKVLRDPGYGMGDEAVRVFKLCPEKWTPGYKEGLPVRCSYVIPITINLKSAEPPKKI
ncbi:energy transducer TonB [Flavobacterium psychrotrophum]|uniref:energy transducer TonB n=1 Tax=Flavobacterium psychrotrophum TaxID=2294119 RepID=UPI0013C3F994|nr:energy transducer TonB [Flavobacterium psychrotrophum]